jgi:hypothetical protein
VAGHRDVTIERGTVQEFGNGVLFDGADGNAVRRVVVLRSVARGIQLQNGSDDNRLEFDTSSNNGRSGFGLLSSQRNSVAHATASGNPFSGLQAFTASGNRIVEGTFTANGAGIGLADGSNGNFVAGNVTSDQTEIGVAVDESSDTW